MSWKWQVLYYEDVNGVCTVLDYIRTRRARDRAKLLSWIEELEKRGPNLPRPYADLLEDGIHELRVKLTGDQVRILYFFCYKDFIILTHEFTKRTQKVPTAEIKKAKTCRTDFLARFDEEKIKEVSHEKF